MSRIQILELPEGAGDDRPPFVLVVDEWEPQGSWTSPWQELGNKIGARAVVVTPETIEIPAAEVTLSTLNERADGNVVRVRVEPDLSRFEDAVADAMASAQKRVDLRLGEGRTQQGGEPEWCCPRAFETRSREHGGTIPGRSGG